MRLDNLALLWHNIYPWLPKVYSPLKIVGFSIKGNKPKGDNAYLINQLDCGPGIGQVAANAKGGDNL